MQSYFYLNMNHGYGQSSCSVGDTMESITKRRNLRFSLRLLFMLTLVFSLLQPVSSVWRRRRRRCGAVSCAWGGWSQWGGCNHPCGNAGTQSRGRGIARQASCGGGGCSGPSSETRGCNRFCYNGGSPRVAYCQCTEPFWNTCCQSREFISLGYII